jgi:transposase
MQTGWFKQVRVKDIDSHSIRALLASWALLVKIKRNLENQIRGLFKNLGLVIGRAKFNGTVKPGRPIQDQSRMRAFRMSTTLRLLRPVCPIRGAYRT